MQKLLCLVLLFTSGLAGAAVHIQINEQQYRYNEPVRLAQVLAPVANAQPWYWPASRVFDLSKDVESQRQDVIALIDELTVALEPNNSRAMALRALRQQIEGWQLAHRVQMPVNFDLARLSAPHNPQFQPGRYQLTLTPRPQVVYLSGLVQQPGPYQYQAMANSAQYTQAVALRDDAEPDFVYVIAPTGEIRKLGTAYWNRDYASVMPGSQIFVPVFSYLLTPSLSELNQKVAELAVNRVL